MICFGMTQIDHAYINVVPAESEFIVYNVLHQVGFLKLAEVQQRIAKADVLKVEFGQPVTALFFIILTFWDVFHRI